MIKLRPLQRLISSDKISASIKEKLTTQYERSDPLRLLKEVERLQDQFWQYAWKQEETSTPVLSNSSELSSKMPPLDSSFTEEEPQMNKVIIPLKDNHVPKKYYRRSQKPRKPLGLRTSPTHPDPFEEVCGQLTLLIEIDPSHSAKSLLEELIKSHSQQFNMAHLRTLQRRKAEWRREYLSQKTLEYNDQTQLF